MERVPSTRLAAYGLLGFPLAMAALPIYVHVPHFYADTLGLSLASVGARLLAARFLDAVQDPLLGWWSDRRRDRRGGRWAFVMAGAPLMALGMVGLFNPPAWTASQLGYWLIANLVIVYTAYSLVTISYQAYGAEISDDIAELRALPLARGLRPAGRVPRRGAARVKQAMGVEASRASRGSSCRSASRGSIAVALAARARSRRRGRASSPRSRRRCATPASAPGPRVHAERHRASIPHHLVLFFIEDVVKRPQFTAAFYRVLRDRRGPLPGGCGWRRIGKKKAWLGGMGV